jgi:hypothetical protein
MDSEGASHEPAAGELAAVSKPPQTLQEKGRLWRSKDAQRRDDFIRGEVRQWMGNKTILPLEIAADIHRTMVYRKSQFTIGRSGRYLSSIEILRKVLRFMREEEADDRRRKEPSGSS